MKGRDHILVSTPGGLLITFVLSLITLATPLLVAASAVTALIGALAPDYDTFKSKAFWDNPFSQLIMKVSKLLLIGVSITAFTLAGYHFYVMGTLQTVYFVVASVSLLLALIEQTTPIISYYVLPSIISILVFVYSPMVYKIIAVLMLLIIWRGHRKVTHALDFYGILFLPLLFIEYNLWAPYVAFLGGYGLHLCMDILTGGLPISFILPLLTLGKIKSRKISFFITRYDSIAATLIAIAVSSLLTGILVYIVIPL